MQIRELISTDVSPLHTDDSVEHALGLLLECNVQHLPGVEDDQLVGLISEEQLLTSFGPECDLQMLLQPDPISARPDHHIFDLTKLMVQHDLTTLPITSEDGTYAGLVRRDAIFEQFARMLSAQDSGAVLALEVDQRDYSLGQLAHAVEQGDVKILSVATEMPDSSEAPIRVTLKLNVLDAARIKHMLEHNGYSVVAAFGETETDDDLQRRAEEFMRFLEV